METFVSRASELLQMMVDDGLTPKRMAFITGYSYQQVWKYIQADATPTTEFLNQLYLETGDIRLVRLITSGRNIVVCEVEVRPDLSDKDLLAEMIKDRRSELARESMLLKILEDGKVDESDRKVIEAYNDEFDKGMSHAFALRDLVNRKFKLATTEEVE